MQILKKIKELQVLALVCITAITLHAQAKLNVLVFSKTAGFRHQSIEAGKKALTAMAQEKGFQVSFSEDAGLFNQKELSKYRTVVFLNTTGDILNPSQQEAFERYIQAGGGYVGIHAATDTEYEWPWYNKLAGAWFLNHPSTPSNVQNGRFFVTEKGAFTAHMPESFERKDEFYSFKNISPDIKVVVKIDEKSYIGGKNGDNHPISWYQEFDGGRSFYTAMGHTDETFSEPLFLAHLWAGIQYTAGGPSPKPLDYSKARPEENRFSKVVLEEKLDEPMELSLLDANRILFIQRKGEVRLYNLATKKLKTIATIPVSTKYRNKEGVESMGEDGLLGLNKDPNFAQNNWIYLFYSSTKGSYNVLSRFTLKGEVLDLASEKEILKVNTQREECCHTGGSIAWDRGGNLYLSTGDNTNPHASNGYSPSDERPGRGPWDAQKSSANTNDLRGKIIRIKPTANGGYTIPAGNLFTAPAKKEIYNADNMAPAGDGGLTRPEIYTMGHRNPFRISVDQKTGFVYWGEVGPDASKPDDSRGPAGHDEVGQARKPGNFGWPHFVGDNKAYFKYDFANNKSLEKWDAAAPTNHSPLNTGLKVLPPAQKAFVWYPYGDSPEFPLVGNGSRNAMAGPVFYSEDFKTATRAFPNYYNGKFFAYDWMRGWVMAITMDKEGNLKSMERFMPSYKFNNPMDMEFAKNGDLYILEYGSGWFSANDDARLIRIEYNGGNRKPQVQLAASQMGGSLPFKTTLKAQGNDADGDALSYTWKISSANGYQKVLSGAEAQLNLSKPGIYKATLVASDGRGGTSTQSVELSAGNEPPVLSLELPNANRSFYQPNKNIKYKVQVSDKEDGSLHSGISADQVSVNVDYLAEGYDKNQVVLGHRSADASLAYAKGKKLIEASDCFACHKADGKSIGPSYKQVALKYKDQKGAMDLLTKKIIAGGAGVWGETAMAAHPQLSNADAGEMVKYILSIGSKAGPTLPTEGSFVSKVPSTDKGTGVYIVRASYEDQGAEGLSPLRTEQSLVLRNSKMDPHAFDSYADVNKMAFNNQNMAIPAKSGAYMLLKDVDLTGIKSVKIMQMAPKPQLNAVGGFIQLRLDGPKGTLLGESAKIEASEKMDFRPNLTEITMNLPQNFDGKNHDLYLVFTNQEVSNQSLMIVLGAEFVLADDGATVSEAATTSPSATADNYAGHWQAMIFGTPQGDVQLSLALSRVDGKLSGTVTAPGQTESVAIDKIEESPENLKLYFKLMEYDLNMTLERTDAQTLSGTLMEMFKVKATREK